jgi:hypothetical protein
MQAPLGPQGALQRWLHQTQVVWWLRSQGEGGLARQTPRVCTVGSLPRSLEL